MGASGYAALGTLSDQKEKADIGKDHPDDLAVIADGAGRVSWHRVCGVVDTGGSGSISEPLYCHLGLYCRDGGECASLSNVGSP